ncbi:MAG TPA: fumarylacetoacetate hydrolase family protein [Caulobacteraceae bacterium]|nr:fumarylacetoacetate hydrolase family protein [Caulobacteraceae bacterium]
MKLATISYHDQILTGVVDGDRINPLASQRPLAEQIAHGVFTGEADAAGSIALAEAQLIAPLAPRRNFICVGWNYVSHFEEGKGKRGGGLQDSQELPAFPTFFTKATTAAAGPFEDLPMHATTTERLDWEVELAVVIGKDGVDISEAEALSHVFGYTVANDISAREVQRRHGGQWFKGKSLDKTCPIGPLLVTADEIADPQKLTLSCSVNGIEKQSATTRQMHFQIPRIIAELSSGMTLLAGDIILTGTPEGVGFTREPPEFLKSGDVMETTIEHIGTMRHRFVG